MHLKDSIRLFQRLGVDPQSLSVQEFNAAYLRLAKRYHPDSNDQPTPELMAHINAARQAIQQTLRHG